MLSLPRRLLKKIHPEGLPGIAAYLYDKLSSSQIFQKHYELIAKDVCNYATTGNVLDIGTGPAWLLAKLDQINPSFKLTGLDISEAMLEKARANLESQHILDKISLVLADAKRLPFDDNSFDLVVSTGSLHHWKNTTSSIEEIHRILKPGKYALIYDLVSDTPKSTLKKVAQDFGKLKMVLLWLHAFEEPFYSKDDIHLVAVDTKFKTATTKFVGVFCCIILKK